MCGIAGFINYNEEDLQEVDACQTQFHRGPDAQRNWRFKNLLLSHQRLSIIDLDPRSNQPFIKDGLAIIFNGEIYNYQELKQKLLADDPSLRFLTTSDTEVLLELYRKKKEACLEDLIGMFAFAILEMETGILFIARDHFGIKPIFYTQIGERFSFASELKTLIGLPGFDKTLNQASVVAAMNYSWLPGNETMFRNCHKLPAAHYMIIDSNGAIKPWIVQYWQLEKEVEPEEEDSAIDDLTDVLEKSISRHMVADVPVSSFLSGGLDSSFISVLAGKINPHLSTYTISTSEKDKKVEQMPDDEKYAQKLADQFQFDHHNILVEPDILKELKSMVFTLDEPIGDPAAINTYLICKAARNKGVKVLLSGMGADEIFFGYRRQKATLMALKFQRVPGFVRKLITATAGILPVKIFGRGIRLTRWARRFLSFANSPVEEAYMQSYSYYNQEELQRLFKADVSQDYLALRKKHSDLFNEAYNNDPINQMCYTDVHMFMQGLNLTYTDRASMAASVEVRVPFIDKLVIQKAMKLKGDLKYKKGESKYILKKVAEKYLPHEIIYRPKASFGAPIRSWISNELRPMVDDLLSKKNIENRGLFNYSFVKELIENDRSGKEDNAYRIYQLLTLELWCCHFLEN
jgi:asparagine synthase (glutamine-hydrolysing)